MGKLLGIVIIFVALFLAALSFHVIRTDDGLEVITKNHLTLQDTYADVRHWGMTDYLTHSARIRDYLFYTKHYQPLKKAVEEKMGGLSGQAKKDFGAAQKSLDRWITGKPE